MMGGWANGQNKQSKSNDKFGGTYRTEKQNIIPWRKTDTYITRIKQARLVDIEY